MFGNGEIVKISENPEPEHSVTSKLFTPRVKERRKFKSVLVGQIGALKVLSVNIVRPALYLTTDFFTLPHRPTECVVVATKKWASPTIFFFARRPFERVPTFFCRMVVTNIRVFMQEVNCEKSLLAARQSILKKHSYKFKTSISSHLGNI